MFNWLKSMFQTPQPAGPPEQIASFSVSDPVLCESLTATDSDGWRINGSGKIRAVECVNFKGPHPYPAEGLPAEPIPEGVDWDLWQGQASLHPFHHELFQHWSAKNGRWWGHWRDYANSQVTGLGSHAYDMVQYALGMDETGPVEFWPVEEEPQARIDFRYANGVEVRLSFPDKVPHRGPQLGAVFTGSECKIEINRNKFTTNPRDFIKNPPDPQLAEKWEGDGFVAKGHVENWFGTRGTVRMCGSEACSHGISGAKRNDN